jgi:membrane dipeptidase
VLQTALHAKAKAEKLPAASMRRWRGYGWRITGPLGEVVNPAGIRTIGDFPNLTAAMERAGWPEAKIRKVMGANWLRLLADVWGE